MDTVVSFLLLIAGHRWNMDLPIPVRALKCPGVMLLWPGICAVLKSTSISLVPEASFLLLGSSSHLHWLPTTSSRQGPGGMHLQPSACRHRLGSGQLPQEFFVLEDIGTDRTHFSMHLAFKPDIVHLEGFQCYPPCDGRCLCWKNILYK